VLVGAKTKTTATVAYQMLGLYPSTMSHPDPYAVEAGKTRLHLARLHAANPGQRRTL